MKLTGDFMCSVRVAGSLCVNQVQVDVAQFW